MFSSIISYVSSLSMSQALGQVFGLVVSLISIYGMSRACDKQFRKMGQITALVDCAHWALLGAYTGAVMAILIAVRVWVANRMLDASPSVKHRAAFGFSVLFTIALWLTWKGPQSLLPWLGVLNATYAYFFTRGITLRKLFVLTNASWVVYSIINVSVGGTLNYVLATGAGLHLIWKMRRQEVKI